MATYEVQVSDEVLDFLALLDEKSRRNCVRSLKRLASGPYPGRGSGNKERLFVRGEELYRLHIARTYTAFYVILEEQNVVRVLELLPIKDAHKKYGYK